MWTLYRFVMTGEQLLANVVPGSAQPFYFDKEYNLTNEEVSKYQYNHTE